MRFPTLLLRVIYGIGIVAGSFFGTLYAIDTYAPAFGPLKPNRIRATHAEQIQAALEGYKKAHGAYPVFPDNPISDLKSSLVDNGYLARIPVDPITGKQYRFVSDGNVYGMLFTLESGMPCLVGTQGRGFWGTPPSCQF